MRGDIAVRSKNWQNASIFYNEPLKLVNRDYYDQKHIDMLNRRVELSDMK